MADSIMIQEVLQKLNNIQYIANIIPVLSVIAVAFIGWYFIRYIKEKKKINIYSP